RSAPHDAVGAGGRRKDRARRPGRARSPAAHHVPRGHRGLGRPARRPPDAGPPDRLDEPGQTDGGRHDFGAGPDRALSPFRAIAAAIRLEDGGPILYRQTRMGLDGRPFSIVKFRSMRVGAEDESGPTWAAPGDPRRTRVGAWLRVWSLDELPQLYNV